MGRVKYDDIKVIEREALEKMNTIRLYMLLQKVTKYISVIERYGFHDSTIPYIAMKYGLYTWKEEDDEKLGKAIQTELKQYKNKLYHYKETLKELLKKREHIKR